MPLQNRSTNLRIWNHPSKWIGPLTSWSDMIDNIFPPCPAAGGCKETNTYMPHTITTQLVQVFGLQSSDFWVLSLPLHHDRTEQGRIVGKPARPSLQRRYGDVLSPIIADHRGNNDEWKNDSFRQQNHPFVPITEMNIFW
jgi:hypothetical protein